MFSFINSQMKDMPKVLKWPILLLTLLGLYNLFPWLFKTTFVVGVCFFVLWIFGCLADDCFSDIQGQFAKLGDAVAQKIAERMEEETGKSPESGETR